MDERSILFSTVMLFAGAVVLAVLLLAGALWAVVRRGRRDLARGGLKRPAYNSRSRRAAPRARRSR